MTRFATIAGVLGLLTLMVGCDDKKSALAPAASSLAPTSPPPPGASITKFAIDAQSKTSMELDAPKLKIRAASTGGTGSLDIDLANLSASRGEVKMDLTTLTTSTYDKTNTKPDENPEKMNAAQTIHARTWLEVGDGEDGKLDEKTKEQHRYAVYAIRSIENPSAQDVTKVAAVKEGEDDVRTVTMTTKGELLIHGHKVDRDGDVEVKFHYPPGGDAKKPSWIGIKTRKPFRVELAAHDVKPRDGFGKLAKGSYSLLGTKVADNADISLDLRAKPQP